MTTREEFKDDLVNTVIHCLLFNEIKGKINFPDDVLERFTKVWAPKDMLETDQKHNTSKECDGLGNDCKDSNKEVVAKR